MTTFESLHADIKTGCDCRKFGVTPEPGDVFYRRGRNLPCQASDFLSYYEEGKKLNGSDCSSMCHHRGVSMYQIKSDLSLRKTQLIESAQFKPISPPIVYFFHVKEEAGLIWYGESSPALHCELLKADNFSTDLHLDMVEAFDSSDYALESKE